MKITLQIVKIACINHRPIRIQQSDVTSLITHGSRSYLKTSCFLSNLIPKFDENQPSNSRDSLRKPWTNQNSAICCYVINYERITVIFKSNLYPIETHIIAKFDENRPLNSRVGLRKPSTNQKTAICCNVINYARIKVIFERNLYPIKTHIIAKFDENRSTNAQVRLRKPSVTEGRTERRTDGWTEGWTDGDQSYSPLR